MKFQLLILAVIVSFAFAEDSSNPVIEYTEDPNYPYCDEVIDGFVDPTGTSDSATAATAATTATTTTAASEDGDQDGASVPDEDLGQEPTSAGRMNVASLSLAAFAGAAVILA